MLIECTDALAVPWSKPDEGIDPNQFDIDLLLNMFPGGSNAVLADGSVRFISNSVDPKVLKLLMTVNDGQIADIIDVKGGNK